MKYEKCCLFEKQGETQYTFTYSKVFAHNGVAQLLSLYDANARNNQATS